MYRNKSRKQEIKASSAKVLHVRESVLAREKDMARLCSM